MEETLGKRIVAQRKRLGLTQDKLAELLGVTAQAVSKWENDQSCPDITMLPKLAALFHITTDELLGIEKKEAPPAEVIAVETEEKEPNGLHLKNGALELIWDGGRKSSIGFAVWILLVGGLLLAMQFRHMTFTAWELLWSTALFVFGAWGLYPHFSVFRFGCALFGGYFILEYAGFLQGFSMSTALIFPIVLILFGLSLLFDALRKPKNGQLRFCRDGNSIGKSHCRCNGDHFDCVTSFGENDYLIRLPRLSGGAADVRFGEMTVDLSGCEEIAENCALTLNCSCGELELLVPRRYRVEAVSSTVFASVDTEGSPDPAGRDVIHLECNVSFGEICIRYI